jgi:uncharacterized iron-regulated membrane protein
MRVFLLKLHYYLAFLFMLPFIIAGLTGMVIAFDHALDEQLNAPMMLHGESPLDDRHAIDFDRAIHAATGALQEGESILTVMVPRTSASNILVDLKSEDGRREAYVSPVDYQLQGQRPRDGHLLRTIYKLHATLLLPPAGDYILFFSASSLALLSIGGIINWLWHPSRKLQLRVKRKMFLRWWDIHRLAGAIAAVLMLVIALSGGTMAFMHSFGKGLRPKAEPMLITYTGDAPLTAAEAIAIAQPVFDDAQVTHISPPADAFSPWRVFLRQPDEPRTSKGMSTVTINPYTGAILQTDDVMTRTGWQKWLLWAFPLHNGEWAGLPMRILHALMGFTLLLLAYTGTRSFLARRKPAKRNRATSSAQEKPHKIAA